MFKKYAMLSTCLQKWMPTKQCETVVLYMWLATTTMLIYYTIFFNLRSVPASWGQLFSSAACYQIPSICVHLLKGEHFHAHMKQEGKLVLDMLSSIFCDGMCKDKNDNSTNFYLLI
jgi:hypothetical protein